MSDPNLIVLYVDKPSASMAFYTSLLGRPPVESSPNFAMFALPSGMMLGMWARGDVKPPAPTGAGTAELCFPADGADAVRRTHAEWSGKGVKIAQAPVQMDFGWTFCALDPDGHRLRVIAPTPPPAA